MEAPSHKRCKKCGEVKPLDEFYEHPQCRDGHVSCCKTCFKARQAGYRQAKRKPKSPLSTTYVAVHLWMGAHVPKSGTCEECGQSAKTEWALIHGREYSRNREDYWELCHRCHNQYDHGGERCYLAKLTAAQVADIRQRYMPGRKKPKGSVTMRSLAAEFGVHPNTIREIVRGHTWKATT